MIQAGLSFVFLKGAGSKSEFMGIQGEHEWLKRVIFLLVLCI